VTSQQSELPHSIIVEDKIICIDAGCLKTDVCEIFKSIIRLDAAITNIKKDYNVNITVRSSITECKHLQTLTQTKTEENL